MMVLTSPLERRVLLTLGLEVVRSGTWVVYFLESGHSSQLLIALFPLRRIGKITLLRQKLGFRPSLKRMPRRFVYVPLAPKL